MKAHIFLFALFSLLSATIIAQPDTLPPSDIDYTGFLGMSQEVYEYRQERLLNLGDFLSKADQPGVVILDTRSKAAYDRKHFKGALHLNFSDFTADKLAKLIPDSSTTILIYCNNNITGDPADFARKSAPLALNIPTFINLYGYGYRNIYELADLVDIKDLRDEMEGLAMEER